MGAKNVKDLIGVVEVKGVILDSQKVVEKLLSAEKNPAVKAIIVRIDSPGGAVGPTQEIYQEIIRINAINPVYASLGTVAASGGYYIAAATRKIYANPGTITGSIGVMMQYLDLSRLYQFLLVSPSTLKSGEYKDAGNPSTLLKEKNESP
jgi:protease-4